MNVKAKGIVRLAVFWMALLLSTSLTSACQSPKVTAAYQPSEAGGSRTDEQTVFYGQEFARRGDKVFFITDETLYVMNLDGSGKAIVTDECSAIAGVTDKYVVYFDADQGAIFRIDRDGDNRTTLVEENTQHPPLLGCTDKWLYYTDINYKTLLRISIDGKQKEQIPGLWPGSFDISGDSMVLIYNSTLCYFSDSESQPMKIKLPDGGVGDGIGDPYSTVCRYQDTVFAAGADGVIKCSLTDKSVQKLVDGKVFRIQTDGDRVYYMKTNNEGLAEGPFSIKVDGTSPAQLTQDFSLDPEIKTYGREIEFYVENGWVYYLHNGLIYRVSSDGTNTEQLTDTRVNLIDVANGNITYCNCSYDYSIQDAVIEKDEPILRRMNADGTNARQFQMPNNAIAGSFISIGNYIYVGTRTEAEPVAYKASKDGTDPKQIAIAEAHKIVFEYNGNGVSPFLFYSKPDSDGIYCANLDGSGEFQISKQAGTCFVYADGWLYFCDSNGLYRTNRDMNGESQCLVEMFAINDFSLGGSRLFFRNAHGDSNDEGIWSVNADGSDLRQLAAGEFYYIGADNEWVYFSDLYTIYKINWGGSTKEAMTSIKKLGATMYSDGYIYYTCGETPSQFCRVNCTTGQKQLICNMLAIGLQCDSDYVYFSKIENETQRAKGIWRVNKKDLKYECIVSGTVSSYNVFNDSIYYTVGNHNNVAVVNLQ